MQIYISLLRGINVAGQKKIKMLDLKTMYQELGYTDVTTYIQSGNVIFKTKKKALDKIEQNIKKAISDTFGFDVPVLVLTNKTLEEIVQNNPYDKSEADSKHIYFTLLKSAPAAEKIAAIEKLEFPEEVFTITDKAIYLWVSKGYGRSKLNNNFFENKLKVQATTRNLKTIKKLLELSATSH